MLFKKYLQELPTKMIILIINWPKFKTYAKSLFTPCIIQFIF